MGNTNKGDTMQELAQQLGTISLALLIGSAIAFAICKVAERHRYVDRWEAPAVTGHYRKQRGERAVWDKGAGTVLGLAILDGEVHYQIIEDDASRSLVADCRIMN